MSSSFVRDCSDSSGASSSSTNKTVIIIVNNESGNGQVYGNELQNILATHGADPTSEISVVQMGGGPSTTLESQLSAVTHSGLIQEEISVPLSFPIEGFPTGPWDGSNIVDGYTELPIDADAYKRLESVLETEEAKQILGEPLLDIVNNPDKLVESLQDLLNNKQEEDRGLSSVPYVQPPIKSCGPKKRRPIPNRRSQRQVDRAEREEVEKILAENQKMLQAEREMIRKEKEEAEKSVLDSSFSEDEISSPLKLELNRGVPTSPFKGKGTKKGTPESPSEAPVKGVNARKNSSVPALDIENLAQDINIRKLSVKIKKLNTDKIDAILDEKPVTSSKGEQSPPHGIAKTSDPVEKGSSILPIEESSQVKELNKSRLDTSSKLCDDNLKPCDHSLSDKCASESKTPHDLMTTNNFSGDTSSTRPIKANPTKRRKVKVVSPLEGKSVKDITNPVAGVLPHKESPLPLATTGKKYKISFENQLNAANLALSNKTSPHNEEKQSPKSPLQISPTISKSLMKYKIPLKNSLTKKVLFNRETSFSKPPTPTSTPLSPASTLPSPTTKNPQLERDPFSKFKAAAKPPLPSKQPQVIATKPPIPPKQVLKPVKRPVLALKKVFPPKNLPLKPSPMSSKGKDLLTIENKSSTKGNVTPDVKVAEWSKSNVSSLQSIKSASNKAHENVGLKTINLESNAIAKTKDISDKKISEIKKVTMNKKIASDQNVRRSVRPVMKKRFADDMMEHASSSSEEEQQEEASQRDDDSVSEVDLVDSSEEEDNDASEIDDDPQRLWCVCRQPHNNRFMICCDRCEDWFHGACVGITKQMGKQMEEEEREWICPVCKKAEKATRGVISPQKKKFKVKSIIHDKEIKTIPKSGKSDKRPEIRVFVYHQRTGVVLSGTDGPKLDELGDFLYRNPDYTVMNPQLIHCIISDKRTGIETLPLEKLGLKKKKKKKRSQSRERKESEKNSTESPDKPKLIRTTKLINAINPETPKKPKLSSSKKKRSEDSIKMTPKSFYANEEKFRKKSTDKFEDRKQKEVKKPPPPPPPPPKTPEIVKVKSETQKYRSSAQNKLQEILLSRKTDAGEDFAKVSTNDIKKLSLDIEEQLFLLFNKDIGFKYKNRYRSIIFNLGDTKNSALCRNVLGGSIPPKDLVQMTSEQLANKELADWRKGEEKKELEAIQKHELERIALGNQYIMKSHKGEIVIEKDDMKTKDADSLINLSSGAPNDLLPSMDQEEDEEQLNHSNHIYDPNCRLCKTSDELSLTKEEIAFKEKLKKEKAKNSYSKSSHHKDKRHRSSSTESRERRHSHKSSRKDRRHSKDHKDRRRSRDRKDSRDSRDRKDRRESRDHKDIRDFKDHKDRRDSKDHKSKRDSKERRHKESRSSRDTDKESHRRRHKESKQDKSDTKVSTSEDVVFFPASPLADRPIDLEPTSTVIGTPVRISEEPSPTLSFPEEMDDPRTSDCEPLPDYSPGRSPATPPLPGDGGDFSPATPPLPDGENPPMTPPRHSAPKSQTPIPIWKGVVNMPEVAKFSVAAFEVSGKALFFTNEVPATMEVVGRINPETVWTYVDQQKKLGTKEILVIRFQPSSEEEKVSYIALYSYLSNKKRYGVIGKGEKSIKDFYIIPLASHQPIHQVLLPLDGPGFEESRPHMLIGVVVRTKHKKYYDPHLETWVHNGVPSKSRARTSIDEDEEDDSSYTPPPVFGVDSEAPEETKGVSSPEPEVVEIKSADAEEEQERLEMLAELNRQIERDKKELSEMQKKVGDKDEEESPKETEETENLPLDKISLPSNLQEILNSIKKKEDEIKDKEEEIKRRLNLPSLAPAILPTKDVDLRLLLPSHKEAPKDQDMRLLHPPVVKTVTTVEVPENPKRSKDPRVKEGPRDPRVKDDPKPSSSLRTMSDADLLAKALEMEDVDAKKEPRAALQVNRQMQPPPITHPPVGPPFMGPDGSIRPPFPNVMSQGPHPPNFMNRMPIPGHHEGGPRMDGPHGPLPQNNWSNPNGWNGNAPPNNWQRPPGEMSGPRPPVTNWQGQPRQPPPRWQGPQNDMRGPRPSNWQGGPNASNWQQPRQPPPGDNWNQGPPPNSKWQENDYRQKRSWGDDQRGGQSSRGWRGRGRGDSRPWQPEDKWGRTN